MSRASSKLEQTVFCAEGTLLPIGEKTGPPTDQRGATPLTDALRIVARTLARQAAAETSARVFKRRPPPRNHP